jgi:hypothetical protein
MVIFMLKNEIQQHVICFKTESIISNLHFNAACMFHFAKFVTAPWQ